MTDPRIDNAIKVGNFRLTSFERVTKLQIDVAKARMELAVKMQEVIQKQIANRVRQFKFRELKHAKRRFIAALNSSKRALQVAERDQQNARRIQDRIAILALGELMAKGEASRCWSAFDQAVRLCSRHYGILKPPSLSPLDRQGVHFAVPGDESIKPENAPSSLSSTLALFLGWAKSRNYVPRVGSPPYAKLEQLIVALNQGFDAIAIQVEAELERTKAEFGELSQKNWQEIDPTA